MPFQVFSIAAVACTAREHLTMQGKSFQTKKLIMCQNRQPAQTSVSVGSFQAKGEPISDAEVDSLTNTEAVGEATMVGTREGDDILTRGLHYTSYMNTWQQPIKSAPNYADCHIEWVMMSHMPCAADILQK